jgi:hypothetical protein
MATFVAEQQDCDAFGATLSASSSMYQVRVTCACTMCTAIYMVRQAQPGGGGGGYCG